MAQVVREYLHLTSGLDYMEFHYFDAESNPCDEKEATKCTVYECDKDGNILRTVNGRVKTKLTKRFSEKLKACGKKLKSNIFNSGSKGHSMND